MDWITCLLKARACGESLWLDEQPLPGQGRVLALAPHPDDPEAVAVTLRMLARGGWAMQWVVLTSGWSGVQDAFAGPAREVKAQVREAEQRDAARLFGLPPHHLQFARLAEDEGGELAATAANRARLHAVLDDAAPDLVLLPHGDDSNATHRLVHAWLLAWAVAQAWPIFALGNEDPKTATLRADLCVIFDEDTARWKGALLECHRSQSKRNQSTRGITFAERILTMNRACPEAANGHYAERFQVEAIGFG